MATVEVTGCRRNAAMVAEGASLACDQGRRTWAGGMRTKRTAPPRRRLAMGSLGLPSYPALNQEYAALKYTSPTTDTDECGWTWVSVSLEGSTERAAHPQPTLGRREQGSTDEGVPCGS